jgi:hypothetical protein
MESVETGPEAGVAGPDKESVESGPEMESIESGPEAGAAGPDAESGETGPEAADRLIHEVVAALVLEMSRHWHLVDEPAEEGWLMLDVFVLGGPAFRGGISGAARRIGSAHLRVLLLDLERRYGDRYAVDPQAGSGPFLQ